MQDDTKIHLTRVVMLLGLMIMGIAQTEIAKAQETPFHITGASVDPSKVRITGVRKVTPAAQQPASQPLSSNQRNEPFYSPSAAPSYGESNYGTYSTVPPVGTQGNNVLNRYAPKGRQGVLITNDVGVDTPRTPKNINISSVKGLAEACQHVIFAQTGRAYNERAYGLCFGYMRGVKNSYDIQKKVSGKGKICFPPNVSWLQIIKVYLKWVDKHPEKLHRIAWEGVISSMRSAFACL